MAGHSKWANIQHRKGRQDAVRSKLFSKLSKEITVAAKMGDPEYYKKIASWLDANALQKYCEADLRCKTDFSIYIEGHSDGNRFGGARYKKSLDIPSGTPYKHFINNEIHNKVTEREITNRLKSNEELGIAFSINIKLRAIRMVRDQLSRFSTKIIMVVLMENFI